MSDNGVFGRYEELFARALRAATSAECDECLAEIESLLPSAISPADRGRLLMCRARVRSNQWRTTEVFEDARAAMKLFERAGEGDLVVDAASWAAAHASRLGELSVAADLATRSLLALENVEDDRLRVEISNRLGIFCISFLDYDRAIEQFEDSLAAAERIGDDEKIWRQLQNIGDGLILAARQKRLANVQTTDSELDRADEVVRELLSRASDEAKRRFGSHRLLAELLVERGHPTEALSVLEEARGSVDSVVSVAQRAALAWVEARCLRLAGRPEEAVLSAERAVSIVRDSNDEHELMLSLEELAACRESAGDLEGALAAAREVKAHMWNIHQRETRQLVEEVWGRADFVRDQATLQSQAAEASRRAKEDPLTGIGNRRILERFVVDEAPRTDRLAMLVVDVDHFKEINDSFGHRIGDAVLRAMGHLLKGEMRAHQVAVRYGGDEFVLGLLGIECGPATAFAERLRSRVQEQDWSAIASGLRVTASVGVAVGSRLRWQAVFAAADKALYAAKDRGRNRVVAGGDPVPD